MVYATSHSLHQGQEAPVGVIEWKSWKLTRKCRSSLAAESQAMADSVDMLNFVRLFFADCLHPVGIDLRRPDEVLKLLPESCAITDCKSLYDALENESLGLGLSEKRTSIEVTSTRQQMRATGIKTNMGKFRPPVSRRAYQRYSSASHHFEDATLRSVEDRLGC